MGAAAIRETHKAATAAATHVRPPVSPGAREKLSRPRVHTDNPVLHRAIEKLGQGATMHDLPDEKAEAIRAWRRDLYYRSLPTEESRSRQRAKWRRRQKRLVHRLPNDLLPQARERAGLTRSALAEAVGVTPRTVAQWGLHSVLPRTPALRAAVAHLLGSWPWPPETAPASPTP